MILAITPGDPDGIGPEIVWKTIRSKRSLPKGVRLLCVGARKPFESLGAPIVEAKTSHRGGLLVPEEFRSGKAFVWLLPAPDRAPKGAFLPGFQSGWSIETATRLVREGSASALVTGPISKERLQRGGYPYPGHTEFLAELTGAGEVTMMLANRDLRITLVTTHLALSQVPRALSAGKIERAVLQTAGHLWDWWGIRRPRIAIAALNPHAGEGGIFGKEEIRLIAPATSRLQRRLSGRAELFGPLPADTLFAKHILASKKEKYDAVVCMYHDQGLIPVKLLDFRNTVNVTLGLPIVRTSVDHGVAFDIAGQGIADPASFQSAVVLAAEIVQKSRNKKT